MPEKTCTHCQKQFTYRAGGVVKKAREHRLLVGDSTKGADVSRVMDGKKAALLATDPPYLVDYTGERPNDSGKDWSDHYHEIDITDADDFFRKLFVNVLDVLAPHAAIYCWHAHKRVSDIIKVWRELGILDHQQIIWIKPTPVFGRVFWHFRHEPCLMGWRKGSIPKHDGDQSTNSVWEIDWEGKQRIVGNAHPTQKPVEIFARPMRKHTQIGDVCLEPFSGSGSQFCAGEATARLVYGLELEPAFVAVALERLSGMGLEPSKAE
jgi:DNA modification methylase